MNWSFQPALNCHSNPGSHNLDWFMRKAKTGVTVLSYSLCPTMGHLEQLNSENIASDEQLAETEQSRRVHQKAESKKLSSLFSLCSTLPFTFFPC